MTFYASVFAPQIICLARVKGIFNAISFKELKNIKYIIQPQQFTKYNTLQSHI